MEEVAQVTEILIEDVKMADIFDLFKKISSESAAKRPPINYIIAGLGNPGDKYYLTRHNAGFLAIDYMAQKYSIKVDRVKYKALCGEGTIAGKGVLLMKPQTMMNLSGEAVASAASFYKIPPENIIVICDDVNFDVGKLRLRAKGSDGGQKGVRSITALLGTEGFPRVKIGVGKKPHPDFDMADWVLSEFREEEKKALFECFLPVCDGVEKILAGDFDTAMQICNSKK